MTEQDLKFKIESYCKRKRNVKTKKNNIKAKGEAYESQIRESLRGNCED